MLANSTPELNAKVKEPLHSLEQHLLARHEAIKDWFAKQWQESSAPVYGSVDLRNAGYKLAPIDMNLFPAGFNNLNPEFLSYSVDAAKKIIEKKSPGAKNILVVPESHTRNLNYWENIHTLKGILEAAGFNPRFGLLSEDAPSTQDISLPSGNVITAERLLRENDHLQLNDFMPDVVLLNNDLSDGIPAILQNLKQALIPPAELGWSQRLKSGHFQYYAKVADEFAKLTDIDPWLVAPLFRHCGKIDFMAKDGMDCVISNAEKLFADLKVKYLEYKIPYEPFVVVKADAGTYGMAVMTVRNVDELRNLNRKQRTRMSSIKGGQPVKRVIIQEGVYTFETIGETQAVAEPVVYLWGECVVGGFYRVHKERSIDENLNAPGMHFEPLPFEKGCNDPCGDIDPDAVQNRFFVYGIVAQLSMLAAAREIADQKKGIKP